MASNPARPRKPRAPTDRAIVIGIGSYPSYGLGGKAANDLQGPVHDATEMANWLQKRANAHVTLITSNGDHREKWKVEDMRPRVDDVERPLDDFVVQSVRAVQDGGQSRIARRLYIYMAGHGFMPENDHLALVTAESINPDYVRSLQVTSWVDWFSDQYHFDEIVLWMDCCAARDYHQPSRKPIYPKVAARQDRAKIFVAFAAKPTQDAYEASIPPGGPVRGVFTARLLEALEGAATDAEGKITSTSIIGYLSGTAGLVGEDAVHSATGAAPEHYFPKRDHIVFRDGTTPTYTVHVPLADGVEVTFRQGPASVAATETVVDGKVLAALGVGYYKAEADGFSSLFEISTGTGSDVDLR